MKLICTLSWKVSLVTFSRNWPLAKRKKPFNRNELKSSNRNLRKPCRNAQHSLSNSLHHEVLVVTPQPRSNCGERSTPTLKKNFKIIKQGKKPCFRPKRQNSPNVKLKLLNFKCSSRKKIKKLIKFNKMLKISKLKKTLKLEKCSAIKPHQSKPKLT